LYNQGTTNNNRQEFSKTKLDVVVLLIFVTIFSLTTFTSHFSLLSTINSACRIFFEKLAHSFYARCYDEAKKLPDFLTEIETTHY
jgi:hypothetical protein